MAPSSLSQKKKKKKKKKKEKKQTNKQTKKKCRTEQGLAALTEAALVKNPVSPVKQLFDSGQVTQTLWS